MARDLDSAVKANEDLHKLRLAEEGREANTEPKLCVQEQHSKGKSMDSISFIPVDRLASM